MLGISKNYVFLYLFTLALLRQLTKFVKSFFGSDNHI